MSVLRFLLMSIVSVSLAVRGFAAEIILTPESPERGKILTLSLDAENASNHQWTIERKDETGKIEDVETTDGGNGAKLISVLKQGEYFISVSYQVAGVSEKARGHFVVQSPQEETSQAADKKLSVSKITQASALNYIAAKIHADPNSIRTASLLGEKLKTILAENKDVESKELIFEDMRAGVKEVVEARLKESLQFVDTEEEVGRLKMRTYQEGLADWTDANEHLIKRLDETTRDAAELRLALNDAVLPALGAESVPLAERTPKLPVPPLTNDSLLRILQANQHTRTISPRKKKCCLGILLGL